MRPQDVFDRIVASHRVIREMVERAETADAAALLTALERLHPLLQEHFAFEEAQGGFHEQICGPGVEGRHQQSSLRDEHRDLLRMCETARALLREGDAQGVARARGFAARLGSHEERESRLAERSSRD